MTLGPKAHSYVILVSATGLAVLFECIRMLRHEPIGSDWLPLAALTLLSGSFTIKVPKLPARLSVSETFVFASVLLFGTCAGTITVALDILVASLRFKRAAKEPIRVVFNVSSAAISIWAAGHLYFALAPTQGDSAVRLPDIFVPLVVLAASYFLLNSGFVALALAFEKAANAFVIWRNNFLWLSLNYFGAASVAALLVSYTRTVDPTALGIIVPLLVISYLTYKTSLGRIEDAHRHVEEVNQLYLSTIETLATAIDAKDQVTSGHIRRVQRFTLGLAKELGVKEQIQLKALEAAALLHDTGKLVVPEHILNKPGKLTVAEFDKMKRHADIGADLLSSIKFPYPVVPIVRHHHENWDGKGYPTGISGTDIPLGARILSVVDCFDALTSDRPYRPRLSTDEAFDILRQRRGNMYDPLVVDTFIDSYAELAPLATEAGRQAKSLVGETTFAPEPEASALSEIRANASEVALLENCAQQITGATTQSDAIHAAWQTLRQLTPVTTCALYRYESSADQVVCQCSAGDLHNLLPGLVIKLGERVSGWCAANRKSAMNSDAHLDLIHMATRFTPPLRSTICIPLMNDERIVGVFTGYSTQESPFEDRHRYAVERVAELLNNRVTSATQSVRNIRSFQTGTRHQ